MRAPIDSIDNITTLANGLVLVAVGLLGCMPTDVDFTPPSDATGDCQTVSGDVIIASANDARSLPQKCFTVAGYVKVINSDLLDLAPLHFLRQAGSLEISQNSQLRTMGGLSQVRVVNQLKVDDNPMLEAVVGLDSTQEVEQVLIRRNPLLRSLGGLRQLQKVGTGGFAIRESGGPDDLRELESIQRIDGTLEVATNEDMTSLKTARPLDSVGELVVSGNRTLASLDFDAKTINGSLTITANEALATIGGFGTLTNMGQDLIITENGGLIDLRGFSASFTTIGRNLKIEHNIQLADVYDLAVNLISVGGSVTVARNPLLSDCRAEAFTLFDDGGGFLEQIGGLIDIGDNSGIWDPCD